MIKGDTPPTVFSLAHINIAQRHSVELQLAWTMFKESLPTKLNTIEVENKEEFSNVLNRALISTGPDCEYVFLVFQTALIPNARCFSEMIDVLENDPELDLVVASDPTDYPVCYFNQYGFELFSKTLEHKIPVVLAYDCRRPLVALVRKSALSQLHKYDNAEEFVISNTVPSAIAMRSYVHSFENYYGYPRSDLVDLIPDHVENLLDIGCAGGCFGQLIKQKLDCKVVGIEQNEKIANMAQAHLDNVVVGDINTVNVSEKFSCVSCLDTLEHFVDPALIIGRIKSCFLKPEGYFLLSIPNVGHWSTVESLLAGRWDYVPEGLMCNTHLRFFTLSSISKLLEKSGFSIIKVHTIDTPIPECILGGLDCMKHAALNVDEDSLKVVSYNILARLA